MNAERRSAESGRESEFVPKTELGKKLYALRMQAIASGMKLLSQDEVLEEVKRRRGGAHNMTESGKGVSTIRVADNN